MINPLVSIVIPTYNRAALITRAIKSVQNQTFREFEIIVVDDSSKDNTKEVVLGLASSDLRIQYKSHAINKGAQAARNTGIKSGSGKWIAFLDSDDERLPNSIELRLTKADQDHVNAVHSEGYIIHSPRIERVLSNIPPLSGNIYNKILSAPGPLFPGLLVNSSALKQINYLDESIISYQEWDTYIRLAKEFKFSFVEDPTFVFYRWSEDTISSDKTRNAMGYKQIVNKHKKEIISHVGRKVLSDHYIIIAMIYGKSNKSKNAILIHKYLALAILNYPSSWRIKLFFNKLFSYIQGSKEIII